ncbi:MAG: restriction endonuclease subunit S [Candidatus Delongbacteria bacterium]
MAWEVRKLGDVAKIMYGYTESANINEIGPKFLRITDIQDSYVNWDTVPYCKINESDFKKHKLRDGDIVFARTGATTGKSYLLENPPDSVAASYLIKVHLENTTLKPEFLYQYFQSGEYWDIIKIGKTGSTLGGFNATKLSELEIPIPPLDEQKRIVAILDEAFSAISTAKENAEKNLKNAKELFESYLYNIFEKKGKDWEEKKLGEVAEYVKISNDKNLPYVGLENIESGTGKFIGSLEPLVVKSSTFYFTDKHVLYGRLRPYLNKVLLPEFEGHCSTEIFPILAKKNLDRRFLSLWLMYKKTMDSINATCTGARMPRANMNAVLDFVIPFPPLKEQQRIVAKLDALSEQTKKLEAVYAKKIADLDELKKSILQKAFRGEL